MRHPVRLSLLLGSASLAALALPSLAAAQSTTAPLPALVSEVRIPNQMFKLQNGLTVVVHEDRKAPVVAVSVWYNVGSKDEPQGKTGFAHLFEHLMFNGSENLPDDYFKYTTEIGATDLNGTTSFDRTNYFQTVPKAALERALFMESDRMGYLLGAVTQQKLDNQRGVVQNEKRQGDNRPGGLIQYEIFGNLFPAGHPYHHTPIGSMADLDAASLADVQAWFRDNYGPNNAVLVLAGDINAAEARPLVQKYFGAIKRGPVNVPAMAAVPPANGKTIVMKDRVPATTLTRTWAIPGMLDKQTPALELGGSVLGGLASSRLDNALVRNEKLAVSVSASASPQHRVGLFSVQATVKPGVDPAQVEKRLDELMADFIAKGPTREELKRAATQEVAGTIKGLEQVGGFGGKAVALAQGQLYAGDSNWYKKQLEEYARVTPAQVQAAFRQYLTRPPLKIRLEPGERPAYQEAKGGTAPKNVGTVPTPTKRAIPPVGEFAALDFPTIERATLSNGIKVTYAQRKAVPVTTMALAFDAGQAADAPNQRGLQGMTLGLLEEGAGNLTSQQIAERQEELGAEIGTGSSLDRSTVTLSALSANLAPSLDLLETVVEQPAFAPAELERVRTQALTGIAQQQRDPNGIVTRVVPSLIWGANHPYAVVGSGDAAAVKGFTRADVVGFQQKWLRPDNMEIFVVSNLPLSQLTQQLEQRFGNWAAPAGIAKGVKNFTAPPPRPASPTVYLVNVPNAPQSVVVAAQVTPLDPRGDVIATQAGSEVLGGNFLSRINMDLREAKGWSYGVNGNFSLNRNGVPYTIAAPVQADRTGDSLVALNAQVSDMLSAKGVTDEELARVISNNVNTLPGRFETSTAVLNAMLSNSLLGRPDDYQKQLAVRYRALSKAGIDGSLRQAIDPKGFTWVVVGDAAKVKPQLDKIGYPVQVIEPK
ncbi:M16 family metallopeptidase [Sphingomonas astaxanthinifaciens]|uniref:Zinc protease n=1 Tax=Sphingomonas astaxanthinifaciens DSM 22298 TaxID=1123267 RepID=A0ABQ5Z9T5_9SPHN|nr:pitrilysin family protein [Sphingomonas astaxanthinifaciens]GLR47544.1 zinc protease [Sphingomonas astaxanthinifaciens DSM 22298]